MGSVDSHSVVAFEVPHAELFWLAPVAAGGVCGYAGGSSWLNPGGAGGSAELKRETQRNPTAGVVFRARGGGPQCQHGAIWASHQG